MSPNSEAGPRHESGARPSGRCNVRGGCDFRRHQTRRAVKRRKRRAPAVCCCVPLISVSGEPLSNLSPAEGSRPTSTCFGRQSCRPRALTRRWMCVLKGPQSSGGVPPDPRRASLEKQNASTEGRWRLIGGGTGKRVEADSGLAAQAEQRSQAEAQHSKAGRLRNHFQTPERCAGARGGERGGE